MKIKTCFRQCLPVTESMFENLLKLNVAFECRSGLGGNFSLDFVKYDESAKNYHFKVSSKGWEEDLMVEANDLENKIVWCCRLPFDFDRSLIEPKSIVGSCVNEKTDEEMRNLKQFSESAFSAGTEDSFGGRIRYGKYTGWDAVSCKM